MSFERVEVVPFTLEHFGLEFGLIAKLLEVDDDVWSVEMQPGNYMAFFEPWDSGEYDLMKPKPLPRDGRQDRPHDLPRIADTISQLRQ